MDVQEAANWILGATTVVFGYIASRGKTKNDRLNKVEDRADRLEQDNRDLHESLIQAQGKIMQMESEMGQEYDRLKSIKQYYDLIPQPAWLKDENHRMLGINRAYSEKFHITEEFYIGKSDRQMYDSKYWKPIAENDDEVLHTMRGKLYEETVPMLFAQKGIDTVQERTFLVAKFPVKINGHYGIGGILVREINEADAPTTDMPGTS